MRPGDPVDPSGADPDGTPHDPDLGSVGEEAVKLFGALADLAKEHGAGAGEGVSGLAGQAASFAREVNDHIATGSAECRYCPVCRVVHAVRDTSPEVRSHLMVAASSLLQAAAAMMESIPPPDGEAASSRGTEVEHIDLDDPDDPDEAPGGGRPSPEGTS